MGESFWTDERFEQLQLLIADGLSASEIAQKIGAKSRCVVIGKIHRHGLKLIRQQNLRDGPRIHRPIRNGGSVIATIKARRKHAAIEARQKQEREISCKVTDNVIKAAVLARATAMGQLPSYEPIDLPVEALTDVKTVALLELKDGMCRWPIDGPDGYVASRRFCGCERMGKQMPYCERHHRLAYIPVPNREKKGKKVLWPF